MFGVEWFNVVRVVSGVLGVGVGVEETFKQVPILLGKQLEHGWRMDSLKMDGAEASYPDSAVGACGRPRRVGGRGGGGAVSCASAGEAASGADLGGSSNYSNEIFED